MRTTSTAEVLRRRKRCRQRNQPLPPPADFVTLELPADAHRGVPCWAGGPTRWVHTTVAAAYDQRYSDVRPHMTSGGIAKRTLLTIAAALARTADRETGRNARPTNATLSRSTGFPIRTIQRARECLRLLGVATEILRGRQRTYIERMASWRMGDAQRGWSSVWALHDDPQVNEVIHKMSPHLGRSHLTSTKSPTAVKRHTRGHAPRARQGAAARRPSIDTGGLTLIRAWRQADNAPRWIYRFSEATWANMLAAPAAAHWSPRDLNQLITDWLTTHPIRDNPPRPIALLGTILKWHTAKSTLADRPSIYDDARQAAEAQAHAAHLAEQAASRQAHLNARIAGRAALAGPGRAAVYALLAERFPNRLRR